MSKSDKNDIMTKDIRATLRDLGTKSGRYFKGTAKLFLASGTEILDSDMPGLTGMISANKDLIEDTAKFLRNPVDSINRTVSKATGSDTAQALHRFARNAMDDLKTGNFYDRDRDRTAYGESTSDLLNNFGGFDMAGFDDKGDYHGTGMTNPELDVRRSMMEYQERNADDRAKATTRAIGASTKAIVSTANANAQTNIRLSIKQHAQTMGAMQNMVTQQAATLQAVNAGMSSILEVNREAHQAVMGQLQTVTQLLTEIRDNTKPAQAEQVQGIGNQYDFMGAHGQIDIKKYLKAVKKNADNKYGLSGAMTMLSGGRSAAELIDMFSNNPWELLTTQVMEKLIPEMVKAQAKTTQKYIEGFIPALLNRFAERGRRFEKATGDDRRLSDFIAGIFGVQPRTRTGIDVSTMNPTAQANLTAKTVKSIEEVIPMWLSRIYSAVSGAPLQAFNYQTGRFENLSGVIARTSHAANDITGSMNDWGIRQRASQFKFKNAKWDEDFDDYLYQWMQVQLSNGNMIDPKTMTRKSFTKGMPSGRNYSIAQEDAYYQAAKALFETMPRHELMQLSADMFGARTAHADRNQRTNQELRDNGLAIAYSGAMDRGLQSKIESRTKAKRYGLYDFEADDIERAHARGVPGVRGVGGAYSGLNSILETLRNGIVTYTYIVGDYTHGRSRADSNPGFAYAAKHSKEVQNGWTRAENMRRQEERNTREQYRQLQEMRDAEIAAGGRIAGVEGFDYFGFQADYAGSITTPGMEDNPAVRRRREQETADFLKKNGSKLKSAWGIEPGRGFGANVKGFLGTAPFKIVEDSLRLADATMFKIIFGEDVPELTDDNEVASLMKVISKSVKSNFLIMKDWFAENIGAPIKDFLFGENGLVGRVKNRANELFIQPLKDKAGGIAGRIKGRIQDSEVYKRTIAEGGDIGTAVGNMVTDAFSKFLYGDLRDSHGKVVGKGGEVEYGGMIGRFKRAGDNLQQVLFGPDADGDDHGSREKWERVKKELNIAAPDMVIGGGIGLIGSMFLPGGPVMGAILGMAGGFIKGSETFKTFLFGEKFTKEKVVIGSDGNPVMVKDPKTGRMVPKTISYESRRGGKIDSDIYDGIKQYLPKVAGGAAIGSILGQGLLPGVAGQIAGGLFGSLAGMVASSDRLRRMLFGDEEDETGDSGLFSKNMRENLLKNISAYGGGMIVGRIAGGGAAALAGGLLPAAIGAAVGPWLATIGSITGLLAGPKLKDMLFGEEQEVEYTDPKTGRKVKKKEMMGGLFGKVYDEASDKLVNPLAEKINTVGHKIEGWFQDGIITPLQHALEPAKKAMHDAGTAIKNSVANIGNYIKDGLNNVFQSTVGMPLKDFMHEKVLTPLEKATSRIFGFVGKVIGGIISAPFKAMEYIFTGKNEGATKEELKRDRRIDKLNVKVQKDRNRQERRAARRRRGQKPDQTDNAIDALRATGTIIGAGVGNNELNDELDDDYEDSVANRNAIAADKLDDITGRRRAGERRSLFRRRDRRTETPETDGQATARANAVVSMDNSAREAKARRRGRERRNREASTGRSDDDGPARQPRLPSGGVNNRTLGRIASSVNTIADDVADIKYMLSGIGGKRRRGRRGTSTTVESGGGKRRGIIGSVVGLAGSVVGAGVSLVTAPFKVLGGMVSGVAGLFGGLMKAGGKLIGFVGQTAVNLVGGFAKAIGNVLGLVTGAAATVAGTVVNLLGSAASTAGKVLGGMIKGAWDLVSFLPRMIGSVVGAAGHVVGGVIGGAGKLVGGVVKAGASVATAPFKLVGGILGAGKTKKAEARGYERGRSVSERNRIYRRSPAIMDLSPYAVNTTQGNALRVWVVGESETPAERLEDRQTKQEHQKERKEDIRMQKRQLKVMERSDRRQHRQAIFGMLSSLLGGNMGAMVQDTMSNVFDDFMEELRPGHKAQKELDKLGQKVIAVGTPRAPDLILPVDTQFGKAIPVFIAGNYQDPESWPSSVPIHIPGTGRMAGALGGLGTAAGRFVNDIRGQVAGSIGNMQAASPVGPRPTLGMRIKAVGSGIASKIGGLMSSANPTSAFRLGGRPARTGPGVVGEAGPEVVYRDSDPYHARVYDQPTLITNMTPDTHVKPLNVERYEDGTEGDDGAAASLMQRIAMMEAALQDLYAEAAAVIGPGLRTAGGYARAGAYGLANGALNLANRGMDRVNDYIDYRQQYRQMPWYEKYANNVMRHGVIPATIGLANRAAIGAIKLPFKAAHAVLNYGKDYNQRFMMPGEFRKLSFADQWKYKVARHGLVKGSIGMGIRGAARLAGKGIGLGLKTAGTVAGLATRSAGWALRGAGAAVRGVGRGIGAVGHGITSIGKSKTGNKFVDRLTAIPRFGIRQAGRIVSGAGGLVRGVGNAGRGLGWLMGARVPRHELGTEPGINDIMERNLELMRDADASIRGTGFDSLPGVDTLQQNMLADARKAKPVDELKLFKRMYSRIDRQAETAKDPQQVFDRAISGASSMEEVKAIQAVQQLNSSGAIAAAATTEDGERKSFFETIMDAFGSDGLFSKMGNIVSGIGTFLAGGGLLNGIRQILGFKTAETAASTATAAAAGSAATTAAEAAAVSAAAGGGVKGAMLGLSSKLISNPLYVAGATVGTIKAAKEGDVVEAVGNGAKAVAGLLNFFRKAIVKLLNSKAVMVVLEKLSVKSPVLADKLLNLFSGAASSLGSTAAASFLAKANLIAMVATAVVDFGRGMYCASEHFNVAPSDITIGMRFAAGMAKAVSSLAFGLLPVDTIAQFVYKIVAGKEAADELAAKQESYSAAIDQFNAENGTNLSIEEFQKKYKMDKNGVITEKKGFFGEIGDAAKAAGGWVKDKATAAGDWIKDKAAGVKEGVSNLMNKVANSGIVQTGKATLKSEALTALDYGRFIRTGDVHGLFEYNPMTNVGEDNPLGGMLHAVNFAGKMVSFIPTGISWLGHKVWDGLLKPAGEKIKAGVNTIIQRAATNGQYVLQGDPIGLWTNEASDEDGNPLGGMMMGIDAVQRYVLTGPAALSWVGHKVWEGLKVIGGAVKTGVQTMGGLVETNIQTGIVNGDPAGMWANEAVDEEGNPMNGFFQAVNFGSKLIFTIPSAISWVGRKAKDGIGNLIESSKTDVETLGTHFETLSGYAKSGDLASIWGVSTEMSGPLSGLFGVIAGAAKLVYSIPAIIQKIAKPLKDAVDLVKGTVEDIGDAIGEKWDDVKEWSSNAAASVSNAATNTWNTISSGASNAWNAVSGFANTMWNGRGGRGRAWGRGGRVKPMSQADSRWNYMRDDGCGPTSAAMVASAYGRGSPAEADSMSKSMGMRDSHGGTNPEFFGRYAASKGFGMGQGPISAGRIASSVSRGQPVVLMGRGGAFGKGSHYLVADHMAGRGKVGIVDPLNAGRKTVDLRDLTGNTSNAVYSWGKGPVETVDGVDSHDGRNVGGSNTTAAAQQALVDKMTWLHNNPIPYSLDWDKQDPDKGYASCASTVGWAYRKTLGVTGMSASSTEQAKDSRFSTIWVNDGSGDVPISMLQPGDILYQNWDRTSNNGNMKHTEMYVGNGMDLSHGGNPAYGPAYKELNNYRKKHTMMVRRYNPFLTGTGIPTIDTSTPVISGGNPNYNWDTASGSASGSTDKGGILSTLKSFLSTIMNKIFGIDDNSSSSSGGSYGFSGNAGTAEGVTLTGNTEKEQIWKFLLRKGLTPIAAAGVMGNFEEESGNAARRMEADYTSSFKKIGFDKMAADATTRDAWVTGSLFPNLESVAAREGWHLNRNGYKGDDGHYYPGIGLAQWTGPRAYKLWKFSNDNGLNWADTAAQLDFFYNATGEFKDRNIQDKMNSMTSVGDTTYQFAKDYEGNTSVHMDKRKANAKAIYEMYKNVGPDTMSTEDRKNARVDGMNVTEWCSAHQHEYETYEDAVNAFWQIVDDPIAHGKSTTAKARAESAAAGYNGSAGDFKRLEYGAGPGYWGRGGGIDLSNNVTALNAQIRDINASMAKVQEEAQESTTVDRLADRFTEAISSATEKGGGGSDAAMLAVMQSVAASMAETVGLLSKIYDLQKTDSDKNASTHDINRAYSGKSPVAAHYPNGETKTDDTGMAVIDRLTAAV